jgi:hypothetical protein
MDFLWLGGGGGKDDQSELDDQAVDGETGVEEQVGYIMCAIFGGCECYLQQCVKCGIKLDLIVLFNSSYNVNLNENGFASVIAK